MGKNWEYMASEGSQILSMYILSKHTVLLRCPGLG